MDRTYIASQNIVQRYLSGDLTVREAREFEKYCLENPDVLNSLPIPVRVKTKMARRPGSELDASEDPTLSNTSIEAAGLDSDDDDDDAGGASRGMPAAARRWVAILAIALILALGGIVLLYSHANDIKKQLTNAEHSIKAVKLQAPASVKEYRVKPTLSPPTAATLNIGVLAEPQFVDLRIDVTEGKQDSFLVTIDSVSAGRVLQIRRIARDSNGELRIGLNSSALGADDYDFKIEGYNWRGETVPVGWVRLGMK